MKKIFILLFTLWCVAGSAQITPTGYLFRNTKERVFMGKFDALTLPAYSTIDFLPGQYLGAGPIRLDTTGADSGLYYYSGLAWRKLATGGDSYNIYTNDSTINDLIDSVRQITLINRNKLFIQRGVATLPEVYNIAPVSMLFRDTVTNNTYYSTNRFGLFMERQAWFDNAVRRQYFHGSELAMRIYLPDSIRADPIGGDGFGNFTSNLIFTKQTTGRSVVRVGSDPTEATSSFIANVLLTHSGASGTSIRTRGALTGIMSYLNTTLRDTIDYVNFVTTRGFNNGGEIKKAVDFYAGARKTLPTIDTSVAFLNPSVASSFIQAGDFQVGLRDGYPVPGETFEDTETPVIGQFNVPSALVQFNSTTKGFLPMVMNTTQRDAISSPATGLLIANSDSLGKLDYYNGSAWVGYGASSGGGSATTIYNGNGALSADRTVDGDANDLFFTDMEAFRIYGTGGTYGSVRLFETSGGAGTVTVGRSTGPYTTWSDSIYHITLGQKIDTTVLKVVTINPSTGALSYSPWMYAGGGGGTPGGSDTYVQYNDGGAFGGDAGFTFNETTNTITLTGSVNLPSSTSEGVRFGGTVRLYDNGSTGRWSPGGGNGQLFTSGSTGIFSVFNSGGSNSVVLDGSGIIYRSSSPLQIQTTGNVGIGAGGTSASARLHLPAGTATASTAPLKLTSGTNLGTPESGAVEWDGTNLFITQATGPTRKTIAYTTDIPTNASGTFTSTITNGTNVTSSTFISASYVRVGNTVTVAIQLQVTATANSAATSIDLSLPVASAFTTITQARGTVTENNGGAGQVLSNDTDDRLTASYISGPASAGVGKVVNVTLQYDVL